MTYKEIVNSILDRLREDRVNTVSETFYSKLVGAFVNDAKRVVEDAWPWQSLLRSVNITVTADTAATYDLEDYTTNEGSDQINNRARIYIDPRTNLPIINIITANRERELRLDSVADDTVTKLTQTNTGESGQVESIFFTANPTAASGKTQLRLNTYPAKPDATETLQLYIINPQNDLANDSDTLQVPSDPVKQLAYLYCLYERGEELGEFLTLTSVKAEGALADAIMFDSGQSHQPEFTVS